MGCCKSSILDGQKRFITSDLNIKEAYFGSKYQNLNAKSKSIKIITRQKVEVKLGHLYQYYEIGDILGEGAFGCVRKGVQLATGHEVAIKTILKTQVRRTDDTNAIMEVEILRKLDHPNIMKILEVIEDSRNYHIITELCTGGELFGKLVTLKSLSESTVSTYMNQLISALSFCHEHQVLHRDLKPENILLQNDREDSPIKIIDFGVSGLSQSNSELRIPQYTSIFYKAPEQFSGVCTDKSDMWSLGVIIYIMLSGYLPFKGKTEDQMAESIKHNEPCFTSAEWQSVSDDAKDLIKHLLDKDPIKRYSPKQAYKHNWIMNGQSQYLFTRSITELGIRNLMKFRYHMKLRQAILEFIVSHLTHNREIQDLQQAFIAMDFNGDGKLNVEEMGVACMVLNYTKEQFEEILDECDANMNGCIDYTEFLTAASNWKKLLNKQKLKASFEAFDTDKNGMISVMELKDALKNDHIVEEEIWNEIFAEVDLNKDGMIDMEEFEAAVLLKEISW